MRSENQVADLEDLAHPPTSKQCEDFVITDGLADIQINRERRHTSSLLSILQSPVEVPPESHFSQFETHVIMESL